MPKVTKQGRENPEETDALHTLPLTYPDFRHISLTKDLNPAPRDRCSCKNLDSSLPTSGIKPPRLFTGLFGGQGVGVVGVHAASDLHLLMALA